MTDELVARLQLAIDLFDQIKNQPAPAPPPWRPPARINRAQRFVFFNRDTGEWRSASAGHLHAAARLAGLKFLFGSPLPWPWKAIDRIDETGHFIITDDGEIVEGVDFTHDPDALAPE